MKCRYARISIHGQSIHVRVHQLAKPGCKEVFHEVASGAKTYRVQRRRLLNRLETDEVLTVTRLGRLARSARDFPNTPRVITGKKAGFRSSVGRHHDIILAADAHCVRRAGGVIAVHLCASCASARTGSYRSDSEGTTDMPHRT
jgi:hypothetical protein